MRFHNPEHVPAPVTCTQEACDVLAEFIMKNCEAKQSSHTDQPWRDYAAHRAREMQVQRAVFFAQDLGVPDDELLAIYSLLFL